LHIKIIHGVNIDSISKDIFFTNILEIIKSYCDNVKIVEPDSTQANLLKTYNVLALTNTKERSILSYTTENSMFYAILDIEPKYYFIKDDFILKNVLQKSLVKGYIQHSMHILKDFNGWSWDIDLYENIDYVSSIIYQNIMIIKGEDFLYNWRKNNQGNKDYLYELKDTIKKVTENDNYYISLCKILYMIATKNDKIKIKKEITNIENQYKNFYNKSKEVAKENIYDLNKLKIYYSILNNSKTLEKEMVNFQKYFLEYMDKKIEKIEIREEIISVLYELRYYQNLLFSEGILLKDYEPLKFEVNKVLKSIITKACKMGIIKIISMNIETNFEILKYVLDNRIINLEDIKIYVNLENEKISIKVYDKEVFDKQINIKFSGNKKDIIIRKKRLIKLFN